MSEEIVERLELKIAYLERANNELSDVVYKQQQELERLQMRLEVLAGKLEALKADEPGYTPEQERPPHY